MSTIARWYREQEFDESDITDCELDETGDGELPLQSFVDSGALTPEALAAHVAGEPWHVPGSKVDQDQPSE